ncbi:hypothetical protein ACPSUI_003980, partial [Escherichia coli]
RIRRLRRTRRSCADATLARLIMPTIGAGSVGRIRRSRRIRQAFTSTANPAESTQLFYHCHHFVIFPVETNVTEMVFYG